MAEPIYLPSKKELVTYIKQLMKEHHITQQQIADSTKIHQTAVSRMLREEKDRSIGERLIYRQMEYAEAHDILNSISNFVSPFPKRLTDKMYTNAEDVEKSGTAYLDEKVQTIAKKMFTMGYTQLVVKNRETGNCEGIITDFRLLKKMLYSEGMSKDWLKTFREREIRHAQLVDKVPMFPLTATPTEIAEALLRHYAVLIDEGQGEYGILTRANFLQFLTEYPF